jgi:hypothetical protein
VIELCRRQLNFADGLIAEEVSDLWEDWMRHVDGVHLTRRSKLPNGGSTFHSRHS